jgi:alkylation response protein AidB-like acyl-CoA dehydrogenase
MYGFEPSDEQKMLIDALQRFSMNELRPAAHEADEDRYLPENLIEKGWELGILQASIPEAYGGFGDYSAVTGVLAAEELAWGDLAGAFSVFVPGLYVLPILLGGTEQQKETLLPTVVEAEWKPYTAALIEPRFDFDPNDLKTKATENGDGLLLTGEKVFVPYADQAEAFIIYAQFRNAMHGFVVPAETEGIEVGERQALMGVNALPLYKLRLDNVRVSEDNKIGDRTSFDFNSIISSFRIATASLGVGLARAAFEYSRDYAKDREVFGVKVAQKQAIAFMLAEMATEIEAIRLLTWKAAWMIDEGKQGANKFAYLAQTGAMDMAMRVTDRAVQILGGHGYIREHPVEMWMRCGRGIASFTGLAMV